MVHRAGNKHGNADGMSRRTSELPQWAEGEEQAHMGQCPQRVDNLDKALAQLNSHNSVARVMQVGDNLALETEHHKGHAGSRPRNFDNFSVVKVKNKSQSRGIKGMRSDSGNGGYVWEGSVANLVQLVLKNGILYRRWHCANTQSTTLQLIIPFDCRQEILKQLHDNPLSGGHMASQKTIDRIKQRFWWPNLSRDVKLWIEKCHPCAARRTAGKQNVAALNPIVVGVRFP